MTVFYVYILQSIDFPERVYTGSTKHLEDRLKLHNAGRSFHTAKYAPWRIVMYIAFSREEKARAFERYLKSGSGCAFAKKYFLESRV